MEDVGGSFDDVFRSNYDGLLRFAARRVGPDAAADVVADVFLVAWRRRAEVPVDGVRLWLFGVATNVILNERRGKARRARLVRRAAAQSDQVPADPSEMIVVGSAVRAALARLPEREQEALRLSEWDQLADAEAATVAGCSHATFRVRLHRARRRLAVELATLDEDCASSPDAPTLIPAKDTNL